MGTLVDTGRLLASVMETSFGEVNGKEIHGGSSANLTLQDQGRVAHDPLRDGAGAYVDAASRSGLFRKELAATDPVTARIVVRTTPTRKITSTAPQA